MRTFFSVRALWVGVLFVAAISMCSCGSTKTLTYMQGGFDTAKLSQLEVKEPVIRKGDILSIIVYSDDPAATALYNQQQTGGGGAAAQSTSGGSGSGASGTGGTSGGSSSGGGGGTTGSGGYLVDEKGNIEFQGLGVIHVENLSRSILKDTLETRLAEFLTHPYCTIRFLNYRFTILGEIARPGIFNVPGEHINLLEALGLGGDLTFYGRRDNILVIREYNGKREFGRLDLTKPDVMASPYFYLLPNDIVYIEANKKKLVSFDQTTMRNVTIAATIVSTLAIIYSIFRNN